MQIDERSLQQFALDSVIDAALVKRWIWKREGLLKAKAGCLYLESEIADLEFFKLEKWDNQFY